MKVIRSSGRNGAFTLLELLCVIGILTVLIVLLLPGLTNARARARRIECVSQLRQAGIAFHAFAHDHNGHFPMRLPANAGGTAESALAARRVEGDFASSFRHLQALSNELVTPKILVCPADDRKPAISFGVLQNENVSYFVGINADYSQPNSILAGDRNLTNDWAGTTGAVVRLGGNFALRWTFELHRFKGNLLFSDCRVEEKNSAALVPALNQFPPIAELALPGTQPTGPTVLAGSGALVPMRPVLQTTSPATPEHKTPPVLASAAPTTPPSKPDLTNAPKQQPTPAALVSNTNPQPDQRGPLFSLLPLWARSAIQMLAGEAACAFYALFLVLLVSVLAVRIWASHKKSASSNSKDELDT